MKNKINSFYACLDMGDLIYSLLFVKLLDIQNLYIDGGREGIKFNWEKAEFLMPLIKYQNYIKNAELFNGQTFDCDYGIHPESIPVMVGTDLTQYHASKFGLKDSPTLNTNWLSAPKDPSFKGKVVINRTARYHGANKQVYHNLLSAVYPFNKSVFVGLKEEHEAFQNEFKLTLPFCQTENALELAHIINSADIFLGNESLACAIATGIGKTSFIEYCPTAANYLFLNKPNIFYF
jgi:hypothetical protein